MAKFLRTGRLLCAKFHMNILTLLGTLICQILIHYNSFPHLPAQPELEASLPIRASFFCTKASFGSKCHACKSSISTLIGIHQISAASSGQKISEINCSSHSPVVGLISSLTLVSKHDLLGVADFLVVHQGICNRTVQVIRD